MGLALPVGGSDEKLGVLVAVGTGELVDRHGCTGVCRSWMESVVGKQVEKPGDHIIEGNQDACTEKTEESDAKNLLGAF